VLVVAEHVEDKYNCHTVLIVTITVSVLLVMMMVDANMAGDVSFVGKKKAHNIEPVNSEQR